MRLRGKLTAEEIQTAGNMLRSRMYWPKFLLKNWYGIALLGAVTWGTAAELASGTGGHWHALGIIWIVIVAIFAWAYWSTKSETKRDFIALNNRLPDWIVLENSGVRFDHASGESAFHPWALYRGWREGGKVILLDLAKEKGSQILPTSDLNPTEKSTLVGILRANSRTPVS